jgi:hypothetical protein
MWRRSIPRSSTSHPDHLGRAVAPIRDQARRGDIELFSRAVEHCFSRADFRLANGGRRLDIHNHRMLQIDEIVVGVGISGDGVGRSCVAGRRIGWRDHLRLDRRRAAEGRVVENRQIFRDCATGGRIEILDLGDASSSMRVRHDYAGVNCESFASHDPFLDAARNHGLEQFPQQIALAETAVAVLGKVE